MEKLCRWQVKQPFNTGSSWVRKPRFKANRSVTNPQKFMWWLWPQRWCQPPAWVPGCCTSSFSGKLNTVRSPSMVPEKNTAFCPVTAHGSSPLFEGKMELWDPSQTCGQTSSICMVLRLDPPNIPSQMHLTSFNLYLFFLPVAYLYMGGGPAYTQADRRVGHPALPLLTLFPADGVSHWAWS